MWQTAVVLLIVAGVLIYIVRHYASVMRGETSACSGCSGSCCSSPDNAKDPVCSCGTFQQPLICGMDGKAGNTACRCLPGQPVAAEAAGKPGESKEHHESTPEKDQCDREN